MHLGDSAQHKHSIKKQLS